MKNKYATPQLFANDVVRDGSPANDYMMKQAATLKPAMQPFATGKELWNEKTRVDIALYDFHKKHDAAPTWTPASEADSLLVLSRMATYFARFQQSDPTVQQSSRIIPDDVRKEVERRGGGQASSSMKPSKSSIGILAALAAVGVFLLMKVRKS